LNSANAAIQPPITVPNAALQRVVNRWDFAVTSKVFVQHVLNKDLLTCGAIMLSQDSGVSNETFCGGTPDDEPGYFCQYCDGNGAWECFGQGFTVREAFHDGIKSLQATKSNADWLIVSNKAVETKGVAIRNKDVWCVTELYGPTFMTYTVEENDCQQRELF
jgi:hypothetical protein